MAQLTLLINLIIDFFINNLFFEPKQFFFCFYSSIRHAFKI